jgi:hypothetical protein
VSRICGFYDAAEVSEAKALLFSTADQLKAKGVLTTDPPRCVSRRNGDGRRKAESADIIDLWEYLDRAKVQLPTFYATKLSSYHR